MTDFTQQHKDALNMLDRLFAARELSEAEYVALRQVHLEALHGIYYEEAKIKYNWRNPYAPRPMPAFTVLHGISTTTRTATRRQRQTRPIPVVLTPEIVARILERRAEQEIDRVEKLYDEYYCQM